MLNKVVLIGRLVRDPELRYTTTNIPVISFTIAVNRPYSSNNAQQQGQEQNNADFISCTAWRNQAENVSKYLSKGSLVAVDGRLQTRDYMDEKINARRYITEVICDSVVFLESKSQRENTNSNNQDSFSRYEEPNRSKDDTSKSINIIEDDLPF